MPDIEIKEEQWKKIQQFKKVVNAVLEDESIQDDAYYVDLVLSLGLEKMIRDLLPNDEEVLTKDIVNMFNENPEYVSKHILDNLKRGKESESIDKIKEKWLPYG